MVENHMVIDELWEGKVKICKRCKKEECVCEEKTNYEI